MEWWWLWLMKCFHRMATLLWMMISDDEKTVFSGNEQVRKSEIERKDVSLFDGLLLILESFSDLIFSLKPNFWSANSLDSLVLIKIHRIEENEINLEYTFFINKKFCINLTVSVKRNWKINFFSIKLLQVISFHFFRQFWNAVSVQFNPSQDRSQSTKTRLKRKFKRNLLFPND